MIPLFKLACLSVFCPAKNGILSQKFVFQIYRRKYHGLVYHYKATEVKTFGEDILCVFYGINHNLGVILNVNNVQSNQ